MWRDSEHNRFALEALEPRILLSGDAVAVGLAAAGSAGAAGLTSVIREEVFQESAPPASQSITYDPTGPMDGLFQSFGTDSEPTETNTTAATGAEISSDVATNSDTKSTNDEDTAAEEKT